MLFLFFFLNNLPWSPHWLGVSYGREAQHIMAVSFLWRRNMTLLWLGLIQVRAEVIAGGGGRGWGHQSRVRALRRGPSAVSAGAIWQPVWQHHHPKAVFVVQGHALQEVVQQLRGYCWVNSGTGGHKSVHVMHTLDVTCGKPLTGLTGHGVHFYGET